MKKAILFLFLFCLTLPTFSQERSIIRDSTAVPILYTNYARFGTILLARAESGLYRIVLADSSGILYTTGANYDETYSHTTTASTTRDTIALSGTYEQFTVYCDDASKPFWVMFGTDSTFCERFPMGGIGNHAVECDTVIVWLESGSATITVTKRHRERK